MFYYADEFNLTWLPTLRAMWSPKGQQVMIATPHQQKKQYGIGAVNYHTGQVVAFIRPHKRRQEIAELLQHLLTIHPTETVYVAWDNASTHQDDVIEAVLRAAAGRLVLLYLPTYSPWLNPIEMLWRHLRRVVTHCELFETMTALSRRTHEFLHFLDHVVGHWPTGELILILDNLSVHRAFDVRLWALAHPRVRFLFQPTYAPWLNLIEPWWKTLRSLALNGRRFEGVEQMVTAIQQATAYWLDHRHPYQWRKAA